MAALVLKPQAGPQTDFLRSTADVVIFGGAAGGGKSYALLLDPLYHINVPGFGASIFRRTLKQVKNKGGLWDTSMKIYGNILKAVPTESRYKWSFPVSDVTFNHLENESDVQTWDGAQIPALGFDELQHFSREMFRYLLSRNRSTCGVKPYCRATCNPDPDSWILELIGWFIGEDGYPIKERSGVKRYFATYQDKFVNAESPEELIRLYKFPATDAKGKPTRFKTVTFIPSKLDDNPALTEADPDYELNLELQSEHERARLRDGNWKVRKQGKLFKREWFKWISRKEYDALHIGSATVGVDPSGGSGRGHDEQGIVGDSKGHFPNDGTTYYFCVDDATTSKTPLGWAREAVNCYEEIKAGDIVAEANYGGAMVESNIHTVDPNVKVKMVTATRGKAVRAEPIASLYEKGLVFHVGAKPELEDEMIGFDPDDPNQKSPNRMDAHVWGLTHLVGGTKGWAEFAKQDLERLRAEKEKERGNHAT